MIRNLQINLEQCRDENTQLKNNMKVRRNNTIREETEVENNAVSVDGTGVNSAVTNIDLLKLDHKSTHLAFYNLMNSNSLIPFIIHPSRIVEGQMPSLIDNIFSNNVNDFVQSGNIYFNLSEHL